MAYDAHPDTPDVISLDGPGGRGAVIRNGSAAIRAFGAEWKARADAENRARMERKARRDALPSLAEQAAALEAVLRAGRAA